MEAVRTLSNTGSGRVLAIVVAFHPDFGRLVDLLQAMSSQADAVLVVDNTPRKEDSEALSDLVASIASNIDVVFLRENVGIAGAQNIGICRAINNGFDFVLLSDQDSIPSPGMVARLKECHANLELTGIRVGCICPEYFDRTTGQVFGFQVQRDDQLFYRSVASSEADPCIEIVTIQPSSTNLAAHAEAGT